MGDFCLVSCSAFEFSEHIRTWSKSTEEGHPNENCMCEGVSVWMSLSLLQMMINGFPSDLEDLRFCFWSGKMTCIIQVVLQLIVTFHVRHSRCKMYIGHGRVSVPRAGSGAISKWVICACDSLVDFGTV